MNLDLEYLIEKAKEFEVSDLCKSILLNEKFAVWSGSGRKGQHHYGDGGLVKHTAEVVKLCLENNKILSAGIDKKRLFLAALFHDVGKMWDYAKENDEWTSTEHKRKIHHISRSAFCWQEACDKENIDSELEDDIMHAILSHHGLREWGSPVCPKTKLAWMLHLCDGISARINDAETWDRVASKPNR